MISTTTSFQRAIARSHIIATRCEVYDGPTLVRTLDIHDGNVWVNYGSAVRRRAAVYLTDSTGELTPSAATDLLAPFGNEIRVYRGVKYIQGELGDEELVLLGVFGISDITIHDSGDGFLMVVEAYDRARKVSRARLTTEFVVTPSVNYASEIQRLISSRVSGLDYSFTSSSFTTPATPLVFGIGDDPWEKAKSMAASVGMDLFFDHGGTCVLIPTPNPDVAEPVYNFIEGQDATFMNLQKKMTNERTFNHVVVTGENTGNSAPVRGEASDTNSNSPTWTEGKYGDVVFTWQDQGVTTTTQANAAAQARLNQVLGRTEYMGMQILPNPALDVPDVVTVTREKSKISGYRYVVDQMTIPLHPARAMDIQVRRRTA